MVTARQRHTATLLPNGKVLLAGGLGPSPASAELYDPSTGIWSATGSLNDNRFDDTAALLPNGKVLVLGGAHQTGPFNSEITRSAELYDPASGTWSRTGFLTTPRALFTATLLPNGNILAAGGNTGALGRTAELYNIGLGFDLPGNPYLPTFPPQPCRVVARWQLPVRVSKASRKLPAVTAFRIPLPTIRWSNC